MCKTAASEAHDTARAVDGRRVPAEALGVMVFI